MNKTIQNVTPHGTFTINVEGQTQSPVKCLSKSTIDEKNPVNCVLKNTTDEKIPVKCLSEGTTDEKIPVKWMSECTTDEKSLGNVCQRAPR